MGSPEVVLSLVFLSALRQYQNNELLLWDRPNDSVHVFYCLLHALRQYRTNEVLLWDRPDLCLLNVFSGHQGNTDRCFGGLGVNVCTCTVFSVLFQRLVRADPVFISLHALLAGMLGLLFAISQLPSRHSGRLP